MNVIPCLRSMLVGGQDERVCGFAAHSVSGSGEFGPLLTAASLRGRGIGAVLLKRCVVDLQRQGHRRAEIIWAGPISLLRQGRGRSRGPRLLGVEKAADCGIIAFENQLRLGYWNVQESVR
jgi:GNAT superfamily N-acetyltransferase